MPVTMSDDDKAFVRAILNNPAELTGWLAYADWLDERDDPRARFIRLELRRLDPDLTLAELYWVVAELGNVRATLDPDWVAVFDRPPVENCDELFAFKCPKKWEALRGTDDPLVRRCDGCEKSVYYCHDLAEAQAHAGKGECVAVAACATRYPGDLAFGPGGRDFGVMTMGVMWPPQPPPRPWWKFW